MNVFLNLFDVLVLDYFVDVLIDFDMCFRICELRLKNICEVEIIVVWIEMYKIVDR